MIAEVIAVGDELTSGERLDTNTQWISRKLAELGVRVVYHSTVADEREPGAEVFAAAVRRADLIIATGGLGPTADDLTREFIAAAAGVELELDEPSLVHIRELFGRRGRTMPPQNEVQAMFPRGSRPIPNPHGTAPGIDLAIPRAGRTPCRLFSLPGVPAELFEMWAQTVGPAVAEFAGVGRVICHRVIKCFGTGESHLEQMLPDLIRRGRTPSVGITVHEGTITLRVTSAGGSREESLAAMEPTIATIRQCLGPLVFGEEGDELENIIMRQLVAKNRTLATAEWGTEGLIAHWLGALRGREGEQYLGGIVAQNEAALAPLGITSLAIREQGATSRSLAEQMATAVREKFAATIGLAVSDVPEPDSAGRYHVAIATDEGIKSEGYVYGGHPAILKVLAAKRALDLLRLN